MERPAKRPRISQAPYNDKEDDELGLEPEEFEQLELSKDPGYQLEQGRAKAAFKLKSTFEHIFEKYEKDFTDVGDEIDLRTGEILVDNGHLQSMGDGEDDAASQAGRTEDAQSDLDSTEEEEKILHGGTIGPDGSSSSTAILPRSLDYNAGQMPRLTSIMDGSSRLSSMMPFSRMPFAPFTPPRSFASFSIPSDPIESPWMAPELPSSAFSAAFRPQGLMGRVGHGPTRTIVRKALPKSQLHEEQQNEDADDDDILLGVSGNGLKRKELPLPEGSKDQGLVLAQDASIEVQNSTDGVVPPPDANGTTGVKTLPGGVENREIRGKKTVESMRPSPKITQPRPRAKKPKPKKDKTVVIVQDPKSTKDPETVTSPSQSRKRPASSSPKQVLVVKSRKRRAESLVQDTASVSGRRSGRERKQIEFYSNTSWPKRGEASERALIVDVSAKGIDTRAYSRIDLSESPHHSPEKLVLADRVQELGPEDALPSSLEAEPGLATEGDDTEARAAVAISEVAERGQPTKPSETFARNVVDPSYIFSDEESDWPRRRDKGRKQPADTGKTSSSQAPKADLPPSEDHEPATEEPSHNTEGCRRRRLRKPSVELDLSGDESGKTGEEQHPSSESNAIFSSAGPVSDAPPKSKNTKSRRSSAKASVAQPSSTLVSEVVKETKGDPNKPADLPVTPRDKKSTIKNDTPQPSSVRTGIISLVSDDEEDELSFGADDLTSSDARRNSFILHKSSPMRSGGTGTPRKTNRNRSLLLSSHSKVRTPVRASLGSTGKLSKSRSIGGRYSLPRSVIRVKGSRASSPSSVLVRTPGGTMRRCGENGFKCDRDFCFTCM